MNDGSLGDPSADERNGGVLGGEHLGQRAAVAFAHHDDDLALSRLVLGEPAVNPISRQVFRSDMAPEIGAVDFGDLSLAADRQSAQRRGHRFAQLVRQNERRFILNAQIPRQGEHALALHLVAEHHDRQEIGLQGQFTPSEQRARSHREIAAARLASPTRIGSSTTIVAGRAAAVRTHRLAVGCWPTQARENILGALVGHPHDFADAERPRRRRQEEMLGHETLANENITRTLSARS